MIKLKKIIITTVVSKILVRDQAIDKITIITTVQIVIIRFPKQHF